MLNVLAWLKSNIAIIGVVIVGILIVLAIGSIKSCSERNKEAAQAKQSEVSGAAFANAVAKGVSVIDNRVATETTVAQATAVVKEEIGNAQSLDAIDAAITAKLCADPRRSNDPACVVP